MRDTPWEERRVTGEGKANTQGEDEKKRDKSQRGRETGECGGEEELLLLQLWGLFTKRESWASVGFLPFPLASLDISVK